MAGQRARQTGNVETRLPNHWPISTSSPAAHKSAPTANVEMIPDLRLRIATENAVARHRYRRQKLICPIARQECDQTDTPFEGHALCRPRLVSLGLAIATTS